MAKRQRKDSFLPLTVDASQGPLLLLNEVNIKQKIWEYHFL